jgi:hypothetical protein
MLGVQTMTLPQLALVPSNADSPGARLNRLMMEAHQAADEQVKALEDALLNIAYMSVEIADGGEIYPVGVREICRRLAEDSVWRAQTLESIQRQSSDRARS